MKKWEYLSVKFKGIGFFNHKLDQSNYDKKLNELGADGWEMISLNTDNDASGSKLYLITLKRELS